MEPKIFRRYSTLFIIISGLLFSSSKPAKACVEFEDFDNFRIAFFRAELNSFQPLRYFYYTPHYYSEIPLVNGASNDQIINCSEWLRYLTHSNIAVKDIDFILNKTKPDLFIDAYKNKTLDKVFMGNSFIEYLLTNKKEDIIDYLFFSKQLEYHFYNDTTPWEWNEEHTVETKFLKETKDYADKKLQTLNDKFLRLRYAFQLLKINKELNNIGQLVACYTTFFKPDQKESIIDRWALLYYALYGEKNTALANYYLSKVFYTSDEKKFVAYQNFQKDSKILTATLKYAKNASERANIITLSVLNYPGPALDKLETISNLDRNNVVLPFLICREINKIEDWLFTEKLSKEKSGLQLKDPYWKVLQKNKATDLLYLRKVAAYVEKLNGQTKDVTIKQYYTICLAHIYFMLDETLLASKKLSEISPNAPIQILRQKLIDETMRDVEHKDFLTSRTLQNSVAQHLKKLQEYAINDRLTNKAIYSIIELLKNKYEGVKDYARAGLCFVQSAISRDKFGISPWSEEAYFLDSYYFNLSYLDQHATTKDIDVLLNIYDHKNNLLDQFLLEQKHLSRNTLLDLKGTIAFRKDDLTTAFNAFSQLPKNFWETTYAFKSYLNENPFIPKCYAHKRDFAYKFNKADFVNELLRLKEDAQKNKNNSGNDYLLLGHAYYNCSYWGNSWMMYQYGRSSSSIEMYSWNGFVKVPSAKSFYNNYALCERAIYYYKLALASSKNREVKAQSQFMLHQCDLMRQISKTMRNYFMDDKDRVKGFNAINLKTFYKDYSTTDFFKSIRCPLLDDFVGIKKKR